MEFLTCPSNKNPREKWKNSLVQPVGFPSTRSTKVCRRLPDKSPLRPGTTWHPRFPSLKRSFWLERCLVNYPIPTGGSPILLGNPYRSKPFFVGISKGNWGEITLGIPGIPFPTVRTFTFREEIGKTYSCHCTYWIICILWVSASVGGVSSANYQRCLESAVWSPIVSDEYICILPDCNSDVSPFRSTLKM